MIARNKIFKITHRKTCLFTCLNLFLLIISLNTVFTDCTGQVVFTVSQPRLSVSEGNLKITYDILNARPDDKFNILLEITDSSGAKINAAALSGDIGDSIKAGINRQIVWNLYADNVFIDNTINVEIIAEKIKPDLASEEKDLSEITSGKSKKEDIKIDEESAVTLTRVNVGNNLLKSAIFPGWGLTTMTKGKPYWILGVAGAGCIASSVYFNHKAHSSYDTYLTSSDDDIIDYWQDAVRQGDLSELLAYSAAAIWLLDLGVVTIKAINMNKSYRRSMLSAFSVSPCIDLKTDTPMLSLKYKF